MRTWILVAGAVAVATSAIVALPARGAIAAQENLALRPPPDWELGEPPSQTKDYLIMEFVKKGEKIDHWTELITMQQFRRTKSSPAPRALYENVKALREKACPGVTEWNIIEESDGALLFEWRTTADCQSHPPQSELVRLIFAKRTYYRVGYNTRGELTAEARTTWLDWLRGLSLIR
jgi:hypothetical protein